jgi:hypothetical protein
MASTLNLKNGLCFLQLILLSQTNAIKNSTASLDLATTENGNIDPGDTYRGNFTIS